MRKLIYLGTSLFFFILLEGCSTLQSFPGTARLGETVTIGLGSHDKLVTSNIDSLKFILDNGTESPELKGYIRSIFKLYADKRSLVYQKNSVFTEQIVQKTGYEPWLNVLVLDLPDKVQEPTMVTGSGQFRITTAKDGAGDSKVIYHGNGTPVDSFWDDSSDPTDNVVKISMTILDDVVHGTGSPASLAYEFGGFVNPDGSITSGVSLNGNLFFLEPLPYALIAPPFDGDPSTQYQNNQYGAVEINVDVQTVSPISSNGDLRVVADDMTVQTQSRRMVSYHVDTAVTPNKLKVIFLSPTASLSYYEPRFSIVLNSNNSFASTPVIADVTYYDVNGDKVITGVPVTNNYVAELIN